MKLFASDLDGTLLGNDHRISPGNLAAIRELEAAGVEFAVATGRAYSDVLAILSRSGLHCAVICCNGTCVYSREGALLHKSVLPLPILRDLCRYMTNHGIFFAINSPEAIHALPDWEEILRGELPCSSPERFKINREVFLSQLGVVYSDTFEDFLEGRLDCCSLSVICLDQEKLQGLADFIRADGRSILTMSGFDSLEILNPGRTKADALRWLASHMDVGMEETGAIGDNYNDLEMLQEAGTSFAMGNAPREIRELCDHVTAANHADGVAAAIQQILNSRGNLL